MTLDELNEAIAIRAGIAMATNMLITAPTTDNIWPETPAATVTMYELKALTDQIALIESSETPQADLATAISVANVAYLAALKTAIAGYKTAAEEAFEDVGEA